MNAIEIFLGNADDHGGLPVQTHLLAHNAWVAVKPLLPIRITQDQDRSVTRVFSFLR